MFEKYKEYKRFRKEAEREIREKQREYNEKLKLLNAKTDFLFLERLIQKCNDNPDLRIDIHLTDGTIINMKTYHEEKQENISDWISGTIEVR